MAEPDLSPAFRTALQEIFDGLSAKLGRPRFELRLDAASHKVRLGDAVLHIPVRYEVHWRRFRTIPTELVRDAAYLAKTRSVPTPDEADCEAFAEAFLRDHLLSVE